MTRFSLAIAALESWMMERSQQPSAVDTKLHVWDEIERSASRYGEMAWLLTSKGDNGAYWPGPFAGAANLIVNPRVRSVAKLQLRRSVVSLNTPAGPVFAVCWNRA